MTMLLGDGRSRWFDKSMQLIVCPGGEAAINMEHTGTDGSVMVRLAGFLTGFESDLREKVPESSKGECSWREIQFHLNNDLREFIPELMRSARGCPPIPPQGFCCSTVSAGTPSRPSLPHPMPSYRWLFSWPTSIFGVPGQYLRGGNDQAIPPRRTEAVRSVSRSRWNSPGYEGTEVSLEQKATAARKAMEEHVRRPGKQGRKRR